MQCGGLPCRGIWHAAGPSSTPHLIGIEVLTLHSEQLLVTWFTCFAIHGRAGRLTSRCGPEPDTQRQARVSPHARARMHSASGVRGRQRASRECICQLEARSTISRRPRGMYHKSAAALAGWPDRMLVEDGDTRLIEQKPTSTPMAIGLRIGQRVRYSSASVPDCRVCCPDAGCRHMGAGGRRRASVLARVLA